MWDSVFVTGGVNLFITIVALLLGLVGALTFLDVDKMKRAEYFKRKAARKAEQAKEAWVEQED